MCDQGIIDQNHTQLILGVVEQQIDNSKID